MKRNLILLLLCFIMFLGTTQVYGVKTPMDFVIQPQYDEVRGFKDGLAIVKKAGKWGCVDLTGKEFIQPLYDEICQFEEGFAAIKKDGKWGMIDTSGKEFIKVQYDEIFSFGHRAAVDKDEKISSGRDAKTAVKKDGKWGIIDISGKEIIKPQYDNVPYFNIYGAAAVNKDGKWGLVDTSGRELISLQYDQMSTFDNGIAQVRKGEKWGVIDKTGKEIIKLLYDEIEIDGLIRVLKDGRWGFFDASGKELIKPQYDDGYVFVSTNKVIRVSKYGKFGLISTSGKKVLECQYDNNLYFLDADLVIYEKNGKYGLIDTANLVEICGPKYDAFSYYGKFVMMKINNKWILIDKFGKEIVNQQFENSEVDYINKNGGKNDWSFADFFVYKKGNKYGIISKSSYTISSAKYEYISDKLTNADYFKITTNGKYGLLDKSGKEIVKPVYDDVGGASAGGMFSIKSNGKWGFIDKAGKTVIKPQFENVGDFTSSTVYSENNPRWSTSELKEVYCKIKIGNKWGLIDKLGKIVVSPKFDDIGLIYGSYFNNGYCKVKVGAKWGLIDKTGKTFINPKFEDIGFFSDDLCAVKLESKWGFINKMGEIVIKPQYEGTFDRSTGIKSKNSAPYFNNNLCTVMVNGKFGVINKTGKYITKKQYGLISLEGKIRQVYFSYNFSGDYKYIDNVGNEYDEIDVVDDKEIIIGIYSNDQWTYFNLKGLLSVEKDGKVGFMDPNTCEFIIYPMAESSYKEFAIFNSTKDLSPYQKDGKWGFIRYQSKLVDNKILSQVSGTNELQIEYKNLAISDKEIYNYTFKVYRLKALDNWQDAKQVTPDTGLTEYKNYNSFKVFEKGVYGIRLTDMFSGKSFEESLSVSILPKGYLGDVLWTDNLFKKCVVRLEGAKVAEISEATSSKIVLVNQLRKDVQTFTYKDWIDKKERYLNYEKIFGTDIMEEYNKYLWACHEKNVDNLESYYMSLSNEALFAAIENYIDYLGIRSELDSIRKGTLIKDADEFAKNKIKEKVISVILDKIRIGNVSASDVKDIPDVFKKMKIVYDMASNAGKSTGNLIESVKTEWQMNGINSMIDKVNERLSNNLKILGYTDQQVASVNAGTKIIKNEEILIQISDFFGKSMTYYTELTSKDFQNKSGLVAPPEMKTYERYSEEDMFIYFPHLYAYMKLK